MKTQKILLSLFLSVFFFSSCTIEKRIYRKGLHIDWSKSNKKTQTSPSDSKQETNDVVFASATENNYGFILPEDQLLPKIDSCDNIVLRNGNEISAKVLEVGSNEIKYKKCENLTGPIYTVKKSEVFMIKYPNGTKDIVPEEKIKEEEDFRGSLCKTTISC